MERTALIVDDSETLRHHVERVLRERDVFDRVLSAADGVEGYKLLIHNRVDLVLCDVVMPGIDGFKLLSLKAERPELVEIPVIMLTGEEDVRAKVKGLGAGASDYLTKPFHDDELVARVKVHLKIKALQDELLEKNTRLEELSRTDGLTKVNNRRYFMEVFELELMRAKRYNADLCFVMADIDHFKHVNDEHGHLAGDRVLTVIAQVLAEDLRKHDVLGRYGGEEFALLLPQTGAEGGRVVAERYRRRIELTEIAVGNAAIKVTISMGIASLLNQSVESVDELVRIADQSLYKAKKAGRNRVDVG